MFKWFKKRRKPEQKQSDFMKERIVYLEERKKSRQRGYKIAEGFENFSDNHKLKILKQLKEELQPIDMVVILETLIDKGINKQFIGNTIDWGGHQVSCSLYTFLDWEFYIEHGLCI